MKTALIGACLVLSLTCWGADEGRLQPRVIKRTNDFKETETLIVWTNLLSRSGTTLGADMAFRSVILRRVTFKQLGDERLKAFDVTELHPDVLAYHGINVEEQVRKDKANEAAYQRTQAAELETLRQMEAARQVALAAQAAAQAEADRQAALEEERAMAEEERALEMEEEMDGFEYDEWP